LTNSRLSNNEILRNAIHISGFLIPLMYVQFFSAHLISVALFLATILYATSEVARKHEMGFPVFSTVTQKAAKSAFEINNFAIAPIAFTSGIILSLLIFPCSIAYTSIAVLTLGDSFASIFGKIFGKTPSYSTETRHLRAQFAALYSHF
jgi:dolichol kinase